jgi:hypothetical protein
VGGLTVIRIQTGLRICCFRGLKNQNGTKVIICDNLSSHFTPHVLQLCRENNIALICLPPNSTHLTQPLDVSFFRSLKVAWQNILSKWKAGNHGKNEKVLPKQSLPFSRDWLKLFHKILLQTSDLVSENAEYILSM